MEHLEDLIREKLDFINHELAEEDFLALFYKKFSGSNYCSSVRDVCNCDTADLVTALVMANNNDGLDVNDVNKVFHRNTDFLNMIDDISEAIAIFEFLDSFLESEIYDEVIDYIENKKKFSITSLFKGSSIISMAFIDCLKHNKINPKDFVSFMRLYRMSSEKVYESIALVAAFKRVIKDMENGNDNLELLGEYFGVKVREKDKDRVISRALSKKWHLDEMFSNLREKMNYGQSIVQQDASKRRTLNKKRLFYEELLLRLRTMFNDGEIKNASYIIAKIPDEDVRLELLKLIYKHNLGVYETINLEYRELSSNDINHYSALLSKYGIELNGCRIESIMKNSLEDLHEMLELLKSVGVTCETLGRIVEISKLEVVKKIVSYAQAGFISTHEYGRHLEIFDESSEEFRTLNKNIDYLNEEEIGVKKFKKSFNALLIPCDLLLKNIEVLKSYSLISCMKYNLNYNFLSSEHLDEGIDTLLELGYEKFLEEDLSILNYQERFLRLRLLKELNVVVNNKNELISYLLSDKFYVRDEDIPNYLYNASMYHIPSVTKSDNSCEVELGDEFSNSTRTLSFNGVLVSKNRFIRNMRSLDSSCDINSRRLYSILHGSVLNDEEVFLVEEALGIVDDDKKIMVK